MRLRRSVPSKPGLARKRRGKGFFYCSPEGDPISDPDTLQRIKDLVIPPAWKNVWISPYPNGHIQAVGTDVAGRRQYLYHEAWQQERAEEKFDRVLELSKELPAWRKRIAEDLAGRGLTRDRVLALALYLLDRGYFRAGGERYAEENESYGIATLQCQHVTVDRNTVKFDYPAKSGVRRTLEIEDGEVVRAVRSLLRRADDTPATLGVPNGIPVGGCSRGRPQYAVQGAGRRRLQRKRSAHLARNGVGRRGVRRRGPGRCRSVSPNASRPR